MSLCVPEWDRSGGMLDAVIPANDFLGPLKGKGEFVRVKRSNLSHLASVPDQDTVELVWNETGHVDMQGQTSKGSKSHWPSNYTTDWSNGHETEDGVTPSKPPTTKDGTLEAVVNETPAEAPAASQINIQDDEMVSWLQYPLDDSLERNYYSDFFGELPNSNMQVLKESFVGQGAGRAQRVPLPGSTGNDTVVNRAASADAAMLLGAGRAAGFLPQAGVEAFSKVRTIQSFQPSVSKWQPHTPHSTKGFNLYPTASPAPSRPSPPGSGLVSAPMLPPRSLPVALTNSVLAHPGKKSGPINFSHFLRPAALIKANLHSLAGITPSPNERFKQQLPGKPVVEASTSTGSSIAESTTTGRSAMGSQRDVDLHFAGSDGQPQNVVGDSRWPAAPTPTSRKEVECAEVEPMDCKAKPMDQDACRLSSVTGSAVLASEKGGSQGTQLPDVQEPTITSSSGGSGNSAERAKEAATSIKRKFRDAEDTDCHSEDGEDESVDPKKPLPGRGSTAKRSRAAEVHNQSERRRRDRINEKMKSLQELIPNSNKTDKASMLDEAIEYLKMLQLQLQMMSMRSGMTLPPMVMPSGLQQHLQMPHMPAMPPMGMGMVGMQMGLGMGMMDMGAAAPGRPVMPMPHAGPSHNGSVPVPPMNMVDVRDPRLHTTSVMDSLNAYLARQHPPMQMPQPLSMDMYSAYMLQQHQHQQHQHQQHQHQHQHHHHHHQTPNLGGGPPP